MALALKNDVLYMHIPKTGGTWLTDVLKSQNLVIGNVSGQHASWDRLTGTYGASWRQFVRRMRPGHRLIPNSPTVFCVVRHPLRWYESWFRYMEGRDWNDWGQVGNINKWHVCVELNGVEHSDFNAFMADINKRFPGFVSQLYARYINGSGAHWLRAENLTEEFIAFAKEVGLSVDEDAARSHERINVSKKQPIEWDPDVLAQTIAYDRAAFDRFGYDADGG